jgi:iron-only hydrogenase group A
MIQVKINNKIYKANEGETVLEVCRREGIRIPTLCYHSDLLPAEGVCRLCLVKTNKHKGLVTSCQTKAESFMEVITEDEDIEKARRYNLELLWADHYGRCNNCPRNGNCELQKLAKEYKIDVDDFIPNLSNFEKNEQLKLLKESLKNRVIDDKNPSIYRDSQYCIECRRCIKACKQIQAICAYEMNYRSIQTKVGTPHEEPLDCIYCGQCTLYCPTAAVTEKDNIEDLEKLIADNKKLKIAQFAPSVRFTLGEEFGLKPGSFVEGKLVAALRKIGIDLVFDTTFSADLTIMEEANELISRLRKRVSGDKTVVLPMFTSCCPSWILFVEKFAPEFIPNLSSCKSPQQMLGALIKTYYPEKKKINVENIASISIMPCTAKKYEAQRTEMGRNGVQDVDVVLTVRELARLIRKKRINFDTLNDDKTDSILSQYSGAGMIFGSTGGVMEAALRTAYEKITCQELGEIDFKEVRGEKGLKEAEINIPRSKCLAKSLKIKVAVAHEIRNAVKILEKIKKGECDYDFVEIMACPSGCLGGGGQPIPTNAETRRKRMQAIYERDKNLPLRKSHENPAVLKVYDEYLDQPGSEKAEDLLHTGYINRKEQKEKQQY